VGLVAPRGIVAASVASVFGLKLAALGGGEASEAFAKADLLVPVTFLTILGTVTLCGLGASPLARRLGLSDSNPQGILFAGSSRWVREFAVALNNLQIPTLLIDTNYTNIAAARMAGLSAKCGNVLSEHMQEEQDLAGIGYFMAVTPSDEVNTLAVMEYIHVFSRANVFQLAITGKSHGRWQSVPESRRGRTLFREGIDHQQLDQLFKDGATIKATPITENFAMEEFHQQHGDEAIVLGVITGDRKLRIRTAGIAFEPTAGESVIAIIPIANSATAHEDQDEEPSISGL
jgi:hypothetical protein